MQIVNVATLLLPDTRPTAIKRNNAYYKELVKDVREYGIKVPITVEKLKNGRLRILDGLSRYYAALDCNLIQVPIEISRVSNG